ncbi:MAG: glycosyltransferase family 2 protein [Proteobacteria bacterium]|nr:glycosyltransferase family 2 protein [Pseudomonadota bacterium]
MTREKTNADSDDLLHPSSNSVVSSDLNTDASSVTRHDVSVVIPLLNEEASLEELHRKLSSVLSSLDTSYEIIYVDDGSTDQSFQILKNLHGGDPHVTVVSFRRNFGKAAALTAGFEASDGEIVITMDADLQDDPAEIPNFIAAIHDGMDLVSGWKKKRHDPLNKRLPSKLFNWVTCAIAGLKLHDFNCGFKAYRRELLDHIELYGELHRYIPALAGWKGFNVGEIVVLHHPRKHGKSKYGYERLLKGFFDIVTIYFTRKHGKRPLHVFGKLGLWFGLLGFGAIAYLIVLWFLGHRPIGDRPLLLFGMLSILFGMQLVVFGLINEMLVKLENRFDKGYVIKNVLK